MTRHVIGIDVGGTKMLGVVLDADAPGEPIIHQRVPTHRGTDAVIAGLADLVAALRAEVASITGSDDVLAVGLGIPGLVEKSGRFRYGPNLPNVIDVNFVERLGPHVGLPVTIDNDATGATWAEFTLGAARDATDAVLITLGTGIGGGVVADGHLVRGVNGFAGEPGHMTVDPDGERCVCGKNGCWESYASGRGMGYLARRAAMAGRADRIKELAGGQISDIKGEHVTEALLEGDLGAQSVMGEFAEWLALGIANFVNILDPEVVVIGGGVVEIGEPLLVAIRKAAKDVVMGYQHRPEVAIVAAALGSSAGAIGAGLLAADRLL